MHGQKPNSIMATTALFHKEDLTSETLVRRLNEARFTSQNDMK